MSLVLFRGAFKPKPTQRYGSRTSLDPRLSHLVFRELIVLVISKTGITMGCADRDEIYVMLIRDLNAMDQDRHTNIKSRHERMTCVCQWKHNRRDKRSFSITLAFMFTLLSPSLSHAFLSKKQQSSNQRMPASSGGEGGSSFSSDIQ